MFERVKLFGSGEKGIALATRHGRNISNCQAAETDAYGRRKFQLLLRDHVGWKLRKEACGIYNCFGHVWASRRTAIYEQPAVEMILQDDGYRQLRNGESVCEGDLALYLTPETTSILHVGLVCEVRAIGATGIPWILSKWDGAVGEVLHHFMEPPYNESDFRVVFWTIGRRE